jgi:DNA/RNA endonuclease YhcR with UshA esterase domain
MFLLCSNPSTLKGAEERNMRALILTIGFLGFIAAALPARAQTIGPAETKTHVGQRVTVEAAVTDVHTIRSGMTFIDLGGHYPDNDFVAVIFSGDAAKFPNAGALEGKTVAISGTVELYEGKPEIVLKSADQLKAK